MSPRASRFRLLAAIAVLAALSAAWLGLTPGDLWPAAQGWEQLRRFAAAALSPAWNSQSELATPLLPLAFEAARQTVAFAAAAISLALLFGAPLGVLASRRWWQQLGIPAGIARPIHALVRTAIGLLRSVHELLWALFLLAAFGLHPAAAVLAIAIPYAGILAKVFSEMLDEAPRDAADALAGAGAGPLAVFAFGLVPRALPDIGAYAFYRFECALRSAAVLGFFGFPTLGKLVYEATGQLYFREAWTYLYVLIALIVVVEAWSALLRQRLTIA